VILPWPDPVIDQLGHDPRSAYAERFWLGLIGPSTAWLLRRLVAGLDDEPAGYQVPVSELARSLGLGARRGTSAALERALWRAGRFDLVAIDDSRPEHPVAKVRRRLPPLTRPQVLHLPKPLRQEHQQWLESVPAGPDAMRRRARQLALSLMELGEDMDHAERQLLRWRYHPAVAHESAMWARDRHQAGAVQAGEADRVGLKVLSSSTNVRTPKPVAPLVT
jgi:hypothetical protein